MFHAHLSPVAMFHEEVVVHPQHKAEFEAEEEVKAQPLDVVSLLHHTLLVVIKQC